MAFVPSLLRSPDVRVRQKKCGKQREAGSERSELATFF